MTLDAVIRRLGTKGFATTAALAEALLASPETVQPLLDQLLVDGVAASVAGAYRLSDAGSARAADLMAADRAAWGVEPAGAALDAFIALDHRMKVAVTDWQLRPGPWRRAAGQRPRRRRLRRAASSTRLAALDADAAAWLAPLEAASARLRGYRARLGLAIERALAGDGRYVASPRVDSFHGAWFELHEDLIGLAGRTREGEAEAGRA